MSETRKGISRRQFLASTGVAAGAAATLTGLLPDTAHPATWAAASATTDPFTIDQLTSSFFATAFIEYAGSCYTDRDGDLWANDNNIYAANGDGRGFSQQPRSDVVVNRISGNPETGITGRRLPTRPMTRRLALLRVVIPQAGNATLATVIRRDLPRQIRIAVPGRELEFVPGLVEL